MALTLPHPLRRLRALPFRARAAVYGNLYNVLAASKHEEEDRLPMTVSHEYLGRLRDRLHTPDVPRYPETIERVLRDYGWAGKEFDIYRCRVQYPLLHSCVRAWVKVRKGWAE